MLIDVLELDHDLGILVDETIDCYLFIIGHPITVLVHVIAAIGIDLPADFSHSILNDV